MLEEPESVPLSLLQHRLLPHRPPLKVLVQLVRDLSGPGPPIGCMLLATV